MDAHEEVTLRSAIRAAREVQEFLWGKHNRACSFEEWKRMFRKRVVKLEEIQSNNPHALVEIKKRLLQQAALSIALLARLEQRQEVPWDAKKEPISNLPQYADPFKDD